MSEQVRIDVCVPGYVPFVRLSWQLSLLAALAVSAQLLPQHARAQGGERSCGGSGGGGSGGR